MPGPRMFIGSVTLRFWFDRIRLAVGFHLPWTAKCRPASGKRLRPVPRGFDADYALI